MTDARFPERWLSDRRVLRLSDRGFRFFVVSLAWSVSNRTDGLIEVADIEMMPGAFTMADTGELLEADLMTGAGGKLQITDFTGTQTSRHELEVLENVRRRDREKKARQRARTGTVPGDSTGGASPGTAQEGQDRQEGQALEEQPPADVFGLGSCRQCGHREQLDTDGFCSIECVAEFATTARSA